jgi:hypothetical protein
MWKTAAGRVLVEQGGARGAGAADNSTRPRQETAGEGIPARAQWRRRAAGGALAIDMASVAKVRWPMRAVWSAAEADALAPRARSYHTCCVFIERHSRGCRDDDDHGRRHVPTYRRICDVAPRLMSACLLFVTMDIKIARALSSTQSYLHCCGIAKRGIRYQRGRHVSSVSCISNNSQNKLSCHYIPTYIMAENNIIIHILTFRRLYILF